MFYFTSDEHYFHKNIIKYQNRPFSSIEEMNEILINNHNSIVKSTDLVYHLGDMVFGYFDKWNEIISRLNGKHYLLIGSHDKINHDIATLFNRVENVMSIKIDVNDIFMSHYAHRRWPKSHYGSWHLFGHNHGNLESYGYSFDVGVDAHNYYPWSYDEIKEKMNKTEVIEYKVYNNKNERN